MTHHDIRETVLPTGIPGGKSILPGTVDGMRHVCYFRHALALDERRVTFLPEYAYGRSARPLVPIDNARGTYGVIQLVICSDPKFLQIPRDLFNKQRRYGFQGHTQTCKFILIHGLITNVRHLVAVQTSITILALRR